MQRYFVAEEYQENAPIQLKDSDYHHAIRVMRMQVGDQCYISFSNQVSVVAEITEIMDTHVSLVEQSKELMAKEMPYAVTIACGYSKGDKFEWVTQKATELGMNQLIGFPAQTSVVKWDSKKLAKKQERFQKIAKEAAEQSHRQVVPTIQLCASIKELEAQFERYDHIL